VLLLLITATIRRWLVGQQIRMAPHS
jgi:hypothetical protein